MFVDTAKAELEAGKGGDGAVSFRHEIYVPKGGPDGGDGGRGGSIIFKADKDTNTLLDFRFHPILKAENGKNGAGQRAAGRSGKDLIVEVPIGTVVKSESGEVLADLVEDKQAAIIAQGGDGGFGNAHFKSSTRQTPKIAEVGEPGEVLTVELELKLLADVGLVGLPNAGKSTFLSVVSNAKPEIADYPFTTLTPNLGVATIDERDILIADIPGLIEGAAEGKGLGHAFLRHVDRTAVLLHLIDVYNDDAGKAYATIRKELEKYKELAKKPEIVALTKCESLDEDLIKMQMTAILEKNPKAEIYQISAPAHQGLTDLLRALSKKISESPQLKSTTAASVEAGGATSFSDNTPDLDAQKRIFLPAPWDADRTDQTGSSPLAETVLPASQCMTTQGGERKEKSFFFSETPQGRLRSMTFLADKSLSEKDVVTGPASIVAHSSSVPRKGISSGSTALPVIKLSDSQYKNTWQVEKLSANSFKVSGEKIEKFARRTDLNNYASVNRLRDILKKLGIKAELTNQGATPDSIIEIANKKFPLVEDY